MSSPGGDIKNQVESWAEIDPDPITRDHLRDLIHAAQWDELSDLFRDHLQFGTAGIRAPMGPGPLRMNRVVVRHTAAGIARELLSTVTNARQRGVVVGHDARHMSASFAADAVEVLQAYGFEVYAFAGPCPTPLVAFAIGYLHVAAGIMVTASHNPATDNGLKVYWDDGAQIVPPLDSQIATHVSTATSESLEERSDTTTSAECIRRFCQPFVAPDQYGKVMLSQGRVRQLGGPATDEPVVHEYIRQGLALIPTTGSGNIPSLKIALTSLHGVGGVLLQRLLGDAGYDDVEVVQAQRLPDPDFPTVAFPNPEEPGALDAVIELATSIDADVALANDPDADRLAAAFCDRNGTWKALSGDELGALFAQHLLSLSDGLSRRILATTVVSSRLCGRIAADCGAEFHETLTGFKWLCRPGINDPAAYQVLLYEEALGYAIGPKARDKDGITAALVLADLVSSLKSQGKTVWDVLDDLAERFGAHVQRNVSIRVSGTDWTARVARAMEQIAAAPPATVGGIQSVASDRPAPDVLRYFLDDGSRVVIRPSGTEPKVKLYCEAVESVGDDGVDQARSRAEQRLDLIEADLRRLLAQVI